MHSPASLTALVFLASFSVRPTGADPQLTSDGKCSCFLTNGSNVAYYSDHRFYDFRNLGQYQGVPAVITDADANANAPVTSDYFKSDKWTSTWHIQSWNNSASSLATGNASVLMVNTPNNVYIQQNTDNNPTSQTYLTLRTIRHPEFQSASEIDSAAGAYQYVSMRMLARTTGSPGAITALFTYRDMGNGAKVQEADLEIRTMDPRNTIQYTNQPSTAAGDDVPRATRNATLPNGLDWTAWAVHRLDWTPTQSTWYVDGVQVANISFQTPRDASQIILNAWSDGGLWSGNMSIHDQAFLQVQWLEMVFNATDSSVTSWTDSGSKSRSPRGIQSDDTLARRADKGKGCGTVCSIDDTSVAGTPAMLWSSAGSRMTTLMPSNGAAQWLSIATILITIGTSCHLF